LIPPGLQEKECSVFNALLQQNAVSVSEKEEQDSLFKILLAKMEQVSVEYEQLKQGPNDSEIKVGQAHISEKEAAIHSIERNIRECRVLSPAIGKVLSVNVNSGEHIDPVKKVAIVIGNDSPLHLHVFIEEKDTWRISPSKGLRAIGVHRNNPNIYFPLQFINVKPCIEEKSRKEGKLELVFSFDKGKAPIYLEQNLDVYIEASSPNDTAYLDYQFNQMKEL